jgi:2-oxoisovalerate dehydrogenase E1 component
VISTKEYAVLGALWRKSLMELTYLGRMTAPVQRAERRDSPVTIDWRAAAKAALLSRALDDLEETELLPQRKVLYQFCARGHEVSQSLLAQCLTNNRDGVGAYYRSRPLALALGLTLQEALASTMMRVGSISDGRDIGVVLNMPSRTGACILPGCGGVGTQYTPAVGWAQAIHYHANVLKNPEYGGTIAVAHGGDGSVASNGFWAALNVATTQRLPLLFYIEDNGYGISVTSDHQTPGGNIAANLAAYRNLHVVDAGESDVERWGARIVDTVQRIRDGAGPALLRLAVPRLSGHSGRAGYAGLSRR